MRGALPDTAVMGDGEAADRGLPAGPRGLLRLFPWSDEAAPSRIEVDRDVAIGREGGPDRAFGDPSVSRRHALVRPAGLLVEVVDLDSRNGTFVREERVSGAQFARPGDVVRFGRTVFLVVADATPYRDWWRLGLDGRLVGGAVMQAIRGLASRFAAFRDPVLITGETGTGKEVVAAEIHRLSGRSGPFVAVNCAAVPHALFESQFFGHRRGAFTGADRDEPGFFRSARDGTILLDEVGDMDPAAQAKLLRVLETGQVVPLGAARPEDIRVRVLSATNRDLAAAVAAGEFRPDLYARLRVLEIALPPLRDRREDVALLTFGFLRDLGMRGASHDALVALASSRWPGNVRELHNALVEAAARAREGGRDEVRRNDLRSDILMPERPPAAEARDQRVARVLTAMREHEGNVAHAARALGLHRAQVYTALRAAGRSASDFRPDSGPDGG